MTSQQPMQVGDDQYRRTIARWCALHGRERTFAEQMEYEALHRQLDAAERANIRAIASDYDEAMRNANHLGTIEL